MILSMDFEILIIIGIYNFNFSKHFRIASEDIMYICLKMYVTFIMGRNPCVHRKFKIGIGTTSI